MNNAVTEIGLLVPAMIDQLAPDCARRAVAMLQGLGYRVVYPPSHTTTGRELYHQGDRDSAKQLGAALIEEFDECSHIVSLSSAEVVYIQQHFNRLFHNTTMHNSYRRFVERCYEFSDFLVNVAGFKATGTTFSHRVALMDHCTSLRGYQSPATGIAAGLHDQPRTLLRSIEGLELVEMGEPEVCCGFGGLFASQFTPISDSLAQRKIDNAINAGAEYLTSTEPSCLIHLQSYIAKHDTPLRTILLPELF